MLSLFRRNTPPFPSQSSWSVHEGHLNGRPIFVRKNQAAKEFTGHRDYRFRVGVAVPLREPKDNGLPTNDEMNQLNSIEDALTEALEANQESLHVLAITTGGMREFVFYTRNPQMARTVIETARTATSTHEVQGYVQEDPSWTVFKQFPG
jgi:hypothetical protein